MRSGIALLTTATIALFALPALAMPDAERLSIEAMGDLNGVALICRNPDETKRLKLAMIENLPKVREYGELFDSQTNVSYLDFIKQKSTCPERTAFSVEVDTAIAELKTVFNQ